MRFVVFRDGAEIGDRRKFFLRGEARSPRILRLSSPCSARFLGDARFFAFGKVDEVISPCQFHHFTQHFCFETEVGLSSRWTAGLNPEQSDAVAHTEGPLLILAGAGSGKTTVLVSRAGRLVDEGLVKAEELCVLTFTNKAARELKERVSHKLGNAGKKIWAGTFHSFGLQLLRRFHKKAGLSREFGVIDSSDAGALVKEILKDFHNTGRRGEKSAYDAERLLNLIGEWREKGIKNATKEEEYEEAVEWALPKYLKRLDNLGMVDFDSLILRPIELMQQDPEVARAVQESFRFVMVDEFQDTNQMQMRLIDWLVRPHRNLAVVGDDDQSIYGWRGACIRNILDFPKSYSGCKVVRLEQNYRSTPEILKVANAVIARNTQRHPKVLRPRPTTEAGTLPEIVVFDDENQESECIGLEIADLIRQGHRKKAIAVLYRSNSQGALLEAELRRQQIPYLMSGGTAFFDRKETRDVLAYLRCAFRPNEVGLRRLFHAPSRGIGEKTIDALTEYSRTHHVPFVEVARNWQTCGLEPRAGHALDTLFKQLETLVELLVQPSPITAGNRLIQFFEEIGYKAHVERHSGNALVATKRWRIMELFAGILDRFVERGGRTKESIRDFVDAMELRDALNDKKEDDDRVQLLTLHACKGLEFPIVFFMGVEEDILPHKTLGSDVTEERRLFYVGVTRAQKQLILTRAKRRRKHGQMVSSAPSRFLLEIPEGLVTSRSGPRPIREDQRKAMMADFFKKLDSLPS